MSNSKHHYVAVDYKNGDEGAFGPFFTPNDSSKCVMRLAEREDVQQAWIKTTDPDEDDVPE